MPTDGGVSHPGAAQGVEAPGSACGYVAAGSSAIGSRAPPEDVHTGAACVAHQGQERLSKAGVPPGDGGLVVIGKKEEQGFAIFTWTRGVGAQGRAYGLARGVARLFAGLGAW